MKTCPACGFVVQIRPRKQGPRRPKPQRPEPVTPAVARDATPPVEPAAESETMLHARDDRTWLELDSDSARSLDAKEGDTVIVKAALAGGDTRELVGTAGTQRRVWLTDAIDVDAVESVTLKRRRRI